MTDRSAAAPDPTRPPVADEPRRVVGTGPLLDMPYERWREVVSVDLDGASRCRQAGARHRVRGGRGRIVAVTSVHEHAPRVGAAPSCAATGGRP